MQDQLCEIREQKYFFFSWCLCASLRYCCSVLFLSTYPPRQLQQQTSRLKQFDINECARVVYKQTSNLLGLRQSSRQALGVIETCVKAAQIARSGCATANWTSEASPTAGTLQPRTYTLTQAGSRAHIVFDIDSAGRRPAIRLLPCPPCLTTLAHLHASLQSRQAAILSYTCSDRLAHAHTCPC
jgi:hypothetical protein